MIYNQFHVNLRLTSFNQPKRNLNETKEKKEEKSNKVLINQRGI